MARTWLEEKVQMDVQLPGDLLTTKVLHVFI